MNFLELVNKRLDKEKLSFITCGSVDDGKSTLIGRLLNDSKSLKEDVISQGLVESKKFGRILTHVCGKSASLRTKNSIN